jgi:hypothetical protein
VLSKPLQQSTDDHDDGADEDRHASTIPLAQPWRNWNCEDRTKLVARRHETNDFGLNAGFAICVLVSLSKVCDYQLN